jgi:hypothetical protein
MRPALVRCLSGTFPALVYATTMLGCVWLLKYPLAEAAPVWRGAIALLPMLPIVWLIRSLVANVLAGDELQRRIDLQAVAVASLLVGLGTLSLGLLVIARVVEISARSALLWIFPALLFGYGLARIWAARRYR